MSEGLKSAFIGPNQITYAKIQQTVSGNVLLGNPTGSTANCQEILLGSNLSITSGTLNKSGSSGTTPSVSANDSNLSFSTGSNLNQLACNPTAARVYTLDNTFLAGQTLTFKNIANTDGDYITIEANDASIIAILPPTGSIIITCKNASPATYTDWVVISKESGVVNYVPTFTGFGTVSNVSASYQIVNNNLYGSVAFNCGTCTAVAGIVTLPTAFTGSNSLFSYLGYFVDNSNLGFYGFTIYNNTTSIGFATNGQAVLTPQNASGNFTNGDLIFLDFCIPIVY